MQIFCLGDSLTRGYGVVKGKDYPTQLHRFLQERGMEVTIHNYGIDGQTTEELHLRLDHQLAQARVGDSILLMIGSNDAVGLRLPVDQFIRNLTEGLVEPILARGLKLWIATLPPIEVEMFFGEDPNRRLSEYNREIRALAKRKSLFLVEQAELDVNLTTDGIHFGEEGYRQMAIRWMKALQSR